jgi:tetratricopeptide (TPR) repeat protein
MHNTRIALIALILFASVSLVAQSGTRAATRAGQNVTVQAPETKKQIESSKTSSAATSKVVPTQKYSDAVSVYQLKVQHAHQLGDHKAEAAAAFNVARASETIAAGDPAKLAVAESAYRQSIQAATEASDSSQKVLATNNLAVLMLKQGKKADALSVLRTVDLTMIASEQRPLYAYNLGRSLEVNGDLNGAFDKYATAYDASPEFVEAASAAFRVLQSSESPRIPDVVRLSEDLIGHGHSEIVGQHLPTLLLAWGGNPDAQRLLAEVLRCYTAQGVTPKDFMSGRRKILEDAATHFPALAKPVAAVKEAFAGKLSPIPEPGPGNFWTWYGESWKADAMGPMLKVIGDDYAENKQYEGALGRYASAWSLTRDPQYALAFASLVRRQPELASQRDLLVSKLVDSMFMAKGDQYRKMNWPNILRMHIAIATIFEDEKRWGTRGDPRSAIFQWDHAITAEREVRKTSPQVPPAPGLHYHLATCLTATGQNAEASREYLAAAELFVQAQDAQAAAEAAKRAAGLGPIGLDAERLHAVQVAINRL